MASLNPFHHFIITTIASCLFIILLLICFIIQPQPSISRRVCIVYTYTDLLLEQKTRLGSIPPSCHNKCNECHPCMAVQVPTLPSHDRLKPGLARTAPLGFLDPAYQGSNNRYSNYKPLGWKCHCGDHFFNP
ncbi:EPIDERMAL PATTERNING FACTOR-like protein 1 [Senna tora]|uniref:Epidermal patterning factor-like protein n=1 Tax=Senna tora TaxID=362788 RepID=A0A835C7P9_9FABA|nr:EPIDERMAL PATTERNING FACTOR-like protein 1 [Senna tora]